MLRLSANRTVPYHEPFFVILALKTIICWNLLEKREPFHDAFLCEKSIKTDIYAVRYAQNTERNNKRKYLAGRFALYTLGAPNLSVYRVRTVP